MSGKHDKSVDDEQPTNLLLTGPIAIRGLGRGVKEAFVRGRPSRHRAFAGGAENDVDPTPLQQMLMTGPTLSEAGPSSDLAEHAGTQAAEAGAVAFPRDGEVPHTGGDGPPEHFVDDRVKSASPAGDEPAAGKDPVDDWATQSPAADTADQVWSVDGEDAADAEGHQHEIIATGPFEEDGSAPAAISVATTPARTDDRPAELDEEPTELSLEDRAFKEATEPEPEGRIAVLEAARAPEQHDLAEEPKESTGTESSPNGTVDADDVESGALAGVNCDEAAPSEKPDDDAEPRPPRLDEVAGMAEEQSEDGSDAASVTEDTGLPTARHEVLDSGADLQADDQVIEFDIGTADEVDAADAASDFSEQQVEDELTEADDVAAGASASPSGAENDDPTAESRSAEEPESPIEAERRTATVAGAQPGGAADGTGPDDERNASRTDEADEAIVGIGPSAGSLDERSEQSHEPEPAVESQPAASAGQLGQRGASIENRRWLSAEELFGLPLQPREHRGGTAASDDQDEIVDGNDRSCDQLEPPDQPAPGFEGDPENEPEPTLEQEPEPDGLAVFDIPEPAVPHTARMEAPKPHPTASAAAPATAVAAGPAAVTARGERRPPARTASIPPSPPRGRIPRAALGRESIGIAVLVVLALICAGLITTVVVKTRHDAEIAASEAARYTPPPLATPEPTTTGPVVAVVGDGSAASAASGVRAKQRWTALLASSLKGSVHAAAMSGMGYTAKSASGETFVQAATEVPSDADVVVFFGGTADSNADSLTLLKAATNAYAAAAKQAPNAKIVVVGPAVSNGVGTAGLQSIRNTLRAAATVVKATWVDPVSGNWLPVVRQSRSSGALSASDEKAIAAKLQAVVKKALR